MATREPLSISTMVDLDLTGRGLTELHTHTQSSVHLKPKTLRKKGDCTNANVLAVIPHWHFAKCYPWRKLAKVYKKHLIFVNLQLSQ